MFGLLLTSQHPTCIKTIQTASVEQLGDWLNYLIDQLMLPFQRKHPVWALSGKLYTTNKKTSRHWFLDSEPCSLKPRSALPVDFLWPLQQTVICFSLQRRPRSSRLSVEKQWSLCPVVHILQRAAEKGGATASQGQGRVTNTPVMNERCDRGEDLSEVLSPTHSGRSAGLVLPPHGTRTPLMSSPEGWWWQTSDRHEIHSQQQQLGFSSPSSHPPARGSRELCKTATSV